MRIYKDLDYVEQLGSGVPRILEHYGEEVFRFTKNFLRMVLPSSEQIIPQVSPQVIPQVGSLLKIMAEGEFSRVELQEKFDLSDKRNFNKNYLLPAIELGLVQMTIPEKPRSRNQKYYLTEKGKVVLTNLK